MSTHRSRHRVLPIGALLALSALLAGCGTAEMSTGAGSAQDVAKVSDAELETYQQRLDEVYKGTFTEPRGPVVDAPAGKSIWLVSYGQGVESTESAAAEMKEAATALGWELQVFDGKYNPARWLEGVQQAVVAGADAIITMYIDCPAIKNGITQAKDSGIPVVSIDGYDCDPELYDHVITYAGGQSKTDFLHDWGAAQAAWVIAKTNGQANILLANGQDSLAVIAGEEGQRAEIEKCPNCTVTSLEFTGADLGPALQQKISQALIKDPEINGFIAGYDSVLTLGGAQALKSSDRLSDIAVMGGEGTSAGMQLIRDDGGMHACAGAPPAWNGLAALDAVVRILADRDPAEADTGIGFQVCDAEHNMSADGEPFIPAIDFEAAYLQLWGKG